MSKTVTESPVHLSNAGHCMYIDIGLIVIELDDCAPMRSLCLCIRTVVDN